MKRAATLALTAGLVVLALAVPAMAGGSYDPCKHKPWKPECQTTTTVAETTTTQGETTTTAPEETTTTAPEETTTTAPEETTTTKPETTTVPGDVVTVWDAGGACEAGRFLLTASWGEGIVRVDLYQRIPGLGDIGDDGGIVPFTESGQTLDATGAVRDTTWVLVPVYLNGYDPEPDEIQIPHQVCPEVSPSSTVSPTVPPSTTPDGEEVLPFTGPSDRWNLYGVAGLVMVVVGSGMVRLARSRA